MARIKTRPILYQPSPEPEQRVNTVPRMDEEKFLPAADEELGEEQMSYMTKLFLSKLSSNHERPEPLAFTRKPTPAKIETVNGTVGQNVKAGAKYPRIAKSSSARHYQLTNGPANIDIPTCPNCYSEFRDAALLEFRQHVETCTRSTTANSGSDVSSLSPPPESLTGLPYFEDGLREGSLNPDGDSEEDSPYPYEDNKFEFLPKYRAPEPKESESNDPDSNELEPNEPTSNKPASKDPVSKELAPREPLSKQPESKQPESKQPESKQPESKQPESKQPESKKPESKKPESQQPESKQPESKKPEFKQPESKQPKSKESASKVLASKEPTPKQPEAKEPGPKEPDSNEPRFNYNDSPQDGADDEDAQVTFKFRKITDPSKFAKSLEDVEDLPYEELYARVTNAQQALVSWQNEYIDLQKIISRYDEREPSKPRVPKSHLIGLGYEDQLESFIYGYEHNTHKSKLGEQRPVQQRIFRGPAVGRELRQRIPTQKATEAELTESPDSDTEHDLRGGRNESIDQDTTGSRRGSRIRNQTSQFGSETRQTPPKRIFPSGKPVGRPKKDRGKNTIGPRIVELQLEFASDVHPDDYQMSTIFQDLRETRRAGQNENYTEQDTDEVDSRPVTSSSIITDTSGKSDSLRGQPSSRNRKRQHTSDFEDALPANKRIRQHSSILDNDKGKGRDVGAHVENDEGVSATNEAVEPSSRSIKMKNTQLNAWARDDGTRRKKQSEDTKKRWEEKKALGYTTLSGPSASPLSSKSKTKKPATKGQAAEQAESSETKQSAASRNMLRRWAEKRRAQELGLPVPKIGRYAKGQTPASTTPDTDRAPDQMQAQASSKGATNKKRKRPAEETGLTENGEVTETDMPPRKKRVNNQKKAMKAEPPEAGAENIMGNLRFSNEKEMAVESHDVSAAPPKQKSNRGKKTLREGNSPTNIIEVEDVPADGAATAKATERGKKATAIVDQGSKEAPAVEAGGETQSAQQMQTRTSGRIRRQDSTAASSWNYTRPSSQSSSRMTRTPTPGLAQSTATEVNGKPDQHAENIAIKQEPLAVPTMPKKKRGRGPNYEWVPIDPIAEAAAAENDRINLEEPSGKTRRTRQPKSISGGNATAVGNASSTQSALEEISRKAKRGRTLKSTADIAPAARTFVEGSIEAARDLAVGNHAEAVFVPVQIGESRKNSTSGSLRSKKTVPTEADPALATQPTKVEIIEEENDIEAARARARKSKSEKMSAVMRGRWASGQMKEVMAKKKANNRARKEAAAVGGTPIVGSTEAADVKPQYLVPEKATNPKPEPEIAPAPASAPFPARRSSRAPKKRRIMTYDGAGDDLDEDSRGFMSSPLGGRSRRPAALRASQNFSKIISAADYEDNDEEEHDSQNEDIIMMGSGYETASNNNNNEEIEDVDREIKKQFDSEYDHFKAIASTGAASSSLLGKRKRKPVVNLEEAMRIELGEEEDEFE